MATTDRTDGVRVSEIEPKEIVVLQDAVKGIPVSETAEKIRSYHPDIQSIDQKVSQIRAELVDRDLVEKTGLGRGTTYHLNDNTVEILKNHRDSISRQPETAELSQPRQTKGSEDATTSLNLYEEMSGNVGTAIENILGVEKSKDNRNVTETSQGVSAGSNNVLESSNQGELDELSGADMLQIVEVLSPESETQRYETSVQDSPGSDVSNHELVEHGYMPPGVLEKLWLRAKEFGVDAHANYKDAAEQVQNGLEGLVLMRETEDDVVKSSENAVIDPDELDLYTEAISNSRRRNTLFYMEDAGGEEVKLGELAEHIAAIENDVDIAQLSSDQRKRVYIGLYQCHMDKLDEAEIVDYNKSRGLVEPADNFSTALNVLNGAREGYEASQK